MTNDTPPSDLAKRISVAEANVSKCINNPERDYSALADLDTDLLEIGVMARDLEARLEEEMDDIGTSKVYLHHWLAELEAERDMFAEQMYDETDRRIDLEARLEAAEHDLNNPLGKFQEARRLATHWEEVAKGLERELDEARANLKDASLLIKKLCQPHTTVLECEAIDWVRRKSGFDPLRLATEGGSDESSTNGD